MEKLENSLELKKVGDFEFYSKIIKELDISKEVLSEDPNDIIINVEDINFERFVCLTGETNKTDCQLLIDTQTGYLYSPKWFNNNLVKLEGGSKLTKFVSEISINGISGWEIEEIKRFNESFQRNTDIFKLYFRMSGANCYCYNSDCDYLYANLTDCSFKLDKKHSLSIDSYSNSKATSPFPTSSNFVNLNIWGENFTNPKFINFLKANSFTATMTAENFSFPTTQKTPNYKSVPTILKELEEKTGTVLHTDKIVFPHQLFQSVSEISKYENLIKYIDFLLFKIDSFSAKNSELLNDTKVVNQRLNNLKTKNIQVQKIKTYLLTKFDFSFNNLETKLIQYKNELIENLENIDSQTIKFFEDENSSVFDFAPKTLDINFNLFGETLTRLYNNQVEKINNFSDEVEFSNFLLEKIENLSLTSQNFVTGQKEKLRNDSETQYVEDEFEKMFSEWTLKIDEIESRYFPIIQSYFNIGISHNAVLESLSLLENYRNLVDDFFQNTRISLVVQYDGNPKSDFLQKIEVEKNMFESCSTIQNQMKDIIEKEHHHLTKKTLNSQSETLLNNQFSNISKLVKSMGQDIQSQFAELINQTFEINLSDAIKYGDELKARDKEISGLIFRMKKDIAKMDIQKLTQSYEESQDIILIENK